MSRFFRFNVKEISDTPYGNCFKKESETMPGNQSPLLEQRLMRNIEEIEKRIKELIDERDALKRLLIKTRWENSALRDVNRTNSATRVLVETNIIESLKKSKGSLSSKNLYKEALKANFELKENTFRTYIHRMKEKGLIENAGWGMWKLPKKDIFS